MNGRPHHQSPPQTIAAKGFKFMTTTEIAFCAMRMYSHFRRTEVRIFRCDPYFETRFFFFADNKVVSHARNYCCDTCPLAPSPRINSESAK